MWCWLHLRSTYISVLEVAYRTCFFYGNLWIPKINCFLALPMYWLVQNFSKVIFCESVIARLVQNLLDSSLLISGLLVHLCMFGNFCAIIFRFFSRSYFRIYVSKHLTGPLSGLFVGPGHLSLWKYYGVVCANS